VYSKLHSCTHFLIALALCVSGLLTAQAQTPVAPAIPPATTTVTAAQAAPVTTASFRGHVADPSGAVIPGATITIATPAGVAVGTATADDTGHYTVNGLAPGAYQVQASVTGFAPFASPIIQLAAGQIKRVDIAMAMEVAQQSVVVTDESPAVSVEAGSNASALVIKGKDLDALSDDPDELSNELTALAGPSAGPSGGQIYIDGFTGGQLPPKSAIREIRINQNPFSAEFDKLGYGRIEILTKPGTDKLHGRFFLQGNDSDFNTGNPFTPVPPYHSIQYNGTVSGSLNKKASFFFSVEARNLQNISVYTAETGVLQSGQYVQGTLTGGILNPSTHINISPRIDLQLGSKNTLTVRYQFFLNNSSGDIPSNIGLPSQATTYSSQEDTVQISDSEIINDHIVNETRFQWLLDRSSAGSEGAAPQVSVPGYFVGGNATSQTTTDHTNHLELQNITTMSVGKQAIKFGTRVRDNRDANSTDANFNGSFSFASLPDYLNMLNGLAQPNATMATVIANCPAGEVCQPNKLNYTTGPAGALANVFDAALFFQDDWKANKNLTLSGGLRWETQNHISDHNDWAPRASFAYALDGHKDAKQAKTVLRGGVGIFYDRFSLSNLLSAERFNGSSNSQMQNTITDPACFNATSLNDIIGGLSTCGTATSSASTVVQVAPHYHSPYTEQFGTSLERQLNKTTTVTATYLHSFGVHQFVTRDSNAYVTSPTAPTGPVVRPDSAEGIVDQFYSEAVFKQNQFIVNVNARFTPNFSLMGFYNVTSANSDGGNGSTASNSYDLSQDYGRASFASRNMVFLMANYQARWGIRLNPFLIAQSGKPFNITTANDLTGDNFFNNRPSLAADSFCSTPTAGYAQTSFGCLDTEPAVPGQSYNPITMNLGNGPAAVAVNLRVSRAWGLGPKVETSSNQAGGAPPPGGGPGGGGGRGGPGGGPGGGLGPGGLGGGGRGGPGGMFGPTDTGRKYSLTFSAQALNIFNDINYGQPTGQVIPSPISGSTLLGPGDRFGKSTSLATGIFSGAGVAASRRIFFQAALSF
jgi:hypothetical protein